MKLYKTLHIGDFLSRYCGVIKGQISVRAQLKLTAKFAGNSSSGECIQGNDGWRIDVTLAIGVIRGVGCGFN